LAHTLPQATYKCALPFGRDRGFAASSFAQVYSVRVFFMNHTEVVLPLAKWQASSGSISGTGNENGGEHDWHAQNSAADCRES
jgi:hypothetical protein